jgi:PAS domain S-box-containing protein
MMSMPEDSSFPSGPNAERYQALFEAFPDGILILDDEGRCVDANASLCQLLGRPRAEILGAPLSSLVPAERAEAVWRALDRLKSLGSFGGELPVCAAGGTALDLEWSSRPHVLPGLHLLVAHDVRARNQAERRLSAEHTVTRLLHEASSLEEAAPGILAALCDTLDGRVGALWQLAPGADRLRCSALWIPAGHPELAAFEQASLGATFGRGEGLPGRVWAGRTAAVIEEIARDPIPRQAAAASAGLTSGFGFPLAVGGELFGVIEFFTDRPFVPDEPLLLMMTAIGHDIAQFVRRRRAEMEVERLHRDLARKTSEYETIFHSVPALIWYKDDKNNILRANRLAAEWLGVSTIQMDGRSAYELYPAEAAKYYEDDLEVIRSGRPRLGVVKPVRGPHGEERWVRTDRIPYRNAEGRIVGVIVFDVDLTDLPLHSSSED